MDLECEGWSKILEIFPDMNFSEELEAQPELAKYLRGAINAKSTGIEHPDSL